MVTCSPGCGWYHMKTVQEKQAPKAVTFDQTHKITSAYTSQAQVS